MQGCSVAPFLTVITVKLHTYLIGYYHFGKTIQASIANYIDTCTYRRWNVHLLVRVISCL